MSRAATGRVRAVARSLARPLYEARNQSGEASARWRRSCCRVRIHLSNNVGGSSARDRARPGCQFSFTCDGSWSAPSNGRWSAPTRSRARRSRGASSAVGLAPLSRQLRPALLGAEPAPASRDRRPVFYRRPNSTPTFVQTPGPENGEDYGLVSPSRPARAAGAGSALAARALRDSGDGDPVVERPVRVQTIGGQRTLPAGPRPAPRRRAAERLGGSVEIRRSSRSRS